mmetsp:Transcript_13630/g.32275  ORF Transcript_13630/g.32275 Transcript_13630/m.32275 type:complete len:185 (+) Transcript_13630:412-966(+)
MASGSEGSTRSPVLGSITEHVMSGEQRIKTGESGQASFGGSQCPETAAPPEAAAAAPGPSGPALDAALDDGALDVAPGMDGSPGLERPSREPPRFACGALTPLSAPREGAFEPSVRAAARRASTRARTLARSLFTNSSGDSGGLSDLANTSCLVRRLRDRDLGLFCQELRLASASLSRSARSTE